MTTCVKRNSTLFPVLPALLDEILSSDLPYWTSFVPAKTRTILAVNVKESDTAFTLEIAAPGLKKEDFKIGLENNTLTITNEKDENIEEKGYIRREYNFQSFIRSFTLPEKVVDSDKIEAKYIDGILEVTIPKQEEEKPKPSKTIVIN